MKNKLKILVTGGAGYIGSHTVVALLTKGHDVCSVDNLSNSQRWIPDAVNEITGRSHLFVEGDVCDLNLMQNTFRDFGPFDGVIHFAAFKAVGESVSQPLKYYSNNLVSLVNLLQVANEFGPGKFVFSSSCTVYGQPDLLPVDESAPFGIAESPYGYTKQVGERIITDFCIANPEFKAICLRYFNPIGAHPSGKIGELPLGIPSNLVPFITQSAIGIRPPIKVWGNDYPTPDGTCIRDYIHVVDLAEAHVTAIEKLNEKQFEENPLAVNLGTGKGTSVLEVIQAFEKVNGLKLSYEFGPRRSGDIVQIFADPAKAKNILDWENRLCVEDGMRDAWKWEQYLRNREVRPNDA
jgi:UDP-glucose 4-epimerase